MKKVMFRLFFLFFLGFLLISCTPKNHDKINKKKITHRPSFLIGQAQFIYKNNTPLPGPARLRIVQKINGKWVSDIIEDKDSNVFHKAMTAEALGFPNRILTIAGQGAYLKLWHRSGKKWISDVLWHPVFGGKFDRLRDVEIGDVTGDSKNDIVIATHDQGVIAVLQGEGLSWKVEELCRKPKTFVHEIEIGDVNGNGLDEFYATPSAPNKMDGTPQPGKIVSYEYKNGKFVETVVEEFPKRHVKEILVTELNRSGKFVLFAALEAEMTKKDGKEEIVDPVKIKEYVYKNGKYEGRIIADLPDRQCRFLNASDLNGDKKTDLVASGFKSGLWFLEQPIADKTLWTKTRIDADSSGYEHATVIYDLDNDGKQEIYVAADDQLAFSRYDWNGKMFVKTKLFSLKKDTITFGLMVGTLASLD